MSYCPHFGCLIVVPLRDYLHPAFPVLSDQIHLPLKTHFGKKNCCLNLKKIAQKCDRLSKVTIRCTNNSQFLLGLGHIHHFIVYSPQFKYSNRKVILSFQIDVAIILFTQSKRFWAFSPELDFFALFLENMSLVKIRYFEHKNYKILCVLYINIEQYLIKGQIS